MSQPHSHTLRIGRASEAYRVYLVTTATKDRRPVFADLANGRLLVNTLKWSDTNGRSTTWTFVVMPDHLHWLFALGEGVDLERVVASVKGYSARLINRRLAQKGSLWQNGFHDHGVRREEDLRAIARYVVMNPIRAGIVRSVREYPLWDARWI